MVTTSEKRKRGSTAESSPIEGNAPVVEEHEPAPKRMTRSSRDLTNNPDANKDTPKLSKNKDKHITIKDENENENENINDQNNEELIVDDNPPDEYSKDDLVRINKDRGLAGLLLMMDKFKPIIPDPVTDYYLARSGFQCDDVRIKRILGLAAQKFITDIATNSMQYCLIRNQASSSKDRNRTSSSKQDKRKVLSMEDLTMALEDHGVNLKKPEYYL